ncbi:hypothetical protein [Vreelandella nanhaiensis]|uniref:Uncharacterized protein n=1 Tax=Vreelandella nanhaiensis TaxID=1258546 RepID=A0A433KQA8_9GAMM|nr:hypothetical protein [Halomonas nanhaiensis]RUR31813.1 hypothetical protein ELY38_10220 [Halomonas nanhaiensis]
MFMTHSKAEQLFGRPFSQEQFWSHVELSTDDLWYYVCTAHTRAEGPGRRYFLLTKIADLMALMEEDNDFFWIEHVMVMTPPHINGTDCWNMHRLNELIAIADSKNLTSVKYMYLLDDSLLYETGAISESNDQTEPQILFSEERDTYQVSKN